MMASIRVSKEQLKRMGVTLPVAAKRKPAHVTGEMNRTESRFAAEVLDPAVKAGEIAAYFFERWKYRLAKRCWLTVDFVVLYADGSLAFFDVKARWGNRQIGREDGVIKLKLLGEQLRGLFRVAAAVREKDGSWTYKEF